MDQQRSIYRTLSSQLKLKIQAWYDETYGKDRDKTNRILGTIHRNAAAGRKNTASQTTAYKSLPSEADAWGVGGVIDGKILTALHKDRLTDGDEYPP